MNTFYLKAVWIPMLLFGVSNEYAYRAVDPILPITQFQLEDDFTPLNAHTNGLSNILYLKPLIQIPPYGQMPLYQGMRFQFQLISTPASSTTKATTNLGDTQFFDLFLWTRDWWEIGIGPMAIFPTALSHSTGQGKWQFGPAFGFLFQRSHTQIGLYRSQ